MFDSRAIRAGLVLALAAAGPLAGAAQAQRVPPPQRVVQPAPPVVTYADMAALADGAGRWSKSADELMGLVMAPPLAWLGA